MAKDEYYPGDAAEEERPQPSEASEEPDEQTFLVPKSALGDASDKQPGDRCEIEVVHVYDGEIEFKYVRHKEKEESSEMANVDKQMDSMASDNMEEE